MFVDYGWVFCVVFFFFFVKQAKYLIHQYISQRTKNYRDKQHYLCFFLVELVVSNCNNIFGMYIVYELVMSTIAHVLFLSHIYANYFYLFTLDCNTLLILAVNHTYCLRAFFLLLDSHVLRTKQNRCVYQTLDCW